MLLSNKDLRLDNVEEAVRNAIMKILQAILCREGFDKAVAAMRIDGFLGDLVGAPAVWQFFGHHVCLNVFFYKSQIVISPRFTGAEPSLIDCGPYAGIHILFVEEKLGLNLMQSLPSDLQTKVQIYKLMYDPTMPKERRNKDNQLLVCVAYRDNRIVPNEGISLPMFTDAQKDLL
ncbi:uncharacterized protein V1518DRAFT_448717 [Limtongia smithiae]|uniref:uncharacterized protein n=1 Tax=Limtongia smithiae TaxID=1125753 RepID=UPI0034CEF630